MSADAAINDWLLQDPVLVGLINGFAIGRVPSAAQFPVLQLQQVGGTAIPDMQNGRNPGLSNYTYQIDVYAKERSVCHQIERATVDRLCNNPPSAFKGVSLDEAFSVYEEDSNTNRLTSRISIWFTQGV